MDLLHGFAKRDSQDKLAEGLFESDDFRGDEVTTSFDPTSYFEAQRFNWENYIVISS